MLCLELPCMLHANVIGSSALDQIYTAATLAPDREP